MNWIKRDYKKLLNFKTKIWKEMTLNVSEIFGLMTLNSTCSFRDRNNDA